MSRPANAITWFQIPATDFGRAVKFYSAVLKKTLREETMLGERMGIFPYDGEGVSGAVTEASYLKPSADGNNLFLLVEGELDQALTRAKTAGGKVDRKSTR